MELDIEEDECIMTPKKYILLRRPSFTYYRLTMIENLLVRGKEGQAKSPGGR